MKRGLSAAILALLLGAAGAGCGPGLGGPSPTAVAALDQVTPPVGASAPATTLTAADGRRVALGERWSSADRTVVVFYRGFF